MTDRSESAEGARDAGASGNPEVDPERRAMAEKMREAAEAFRSGELEEMEIPLPDGRSVRMTRDESQPGGFVVQAGAEGPAMRSLPFQPSEDRPEEYPEDLPFLPNCAVSLAQMGEESRSVTWYNPRDLAASYSDLQEQLREAGWEAGREEEGSQELGVERWVSFTRGSRERLLSLSRFGPRGQLLLLEKPRKSGQD